MIRLRLPPAALGREYLAIPFFTFMVDSRLTTERITPHLQSILGIGGGNKKTKIIQGISAGGVSTGALLELKDVSVPTATDSLSIPIPELHAVVTDFPQEHIDPAHDPVEGMIGMEFLSLFDVELDFSRNRLRLYRLGKATHDENNLAINEAL